MVIRRIGVGSAAKIAGLLYACIGLIIGGIIALVSLAGAGFMAAAANNNEMPALFSAMFGIGAVIIAPICYGIFGLIAGTLSAVTLQTFVAGVAGGLELETQ